MNLEVILKTVNPYFLNLCERIFMYGPQGKLLLRNLEDYWYTHCVTMSRYNVFPCDTIADTLKLLQNSSMDTVPFALATFSMSKNTWNELLLPAGKISSHKTGKVSIIVDASESRTLLQKKQRERKVWWRKLAQSPSRFVLAEAKKAKTFDVTEIEAIFPFGNIIVETITHYPSARKLYPQV